MIKLLCSGYSIFIVQLPGGRQLFVTTGGGALWTQQRSSGVCYKRRREIDMWPCYLDISLVVSQKKSLLYTLWPVMKKTPTQVSDESRDIFPLTFYMLWDKQAEGGTGSRPSVCLSITRHRVWYLPIGSNCVYIGNNHLCTYRQHQQPHHSVSSRIAAFMVELSLTFDLNTGAVSRI